VIRRPHSRGCRTARSRRLTLEVLETRTTPASFGIPWQDPRHLTISFAPDGTGIAGHQSSLFHTLDGSLPTAAWQREVLQAFQTWASYANIDVSVKADGGQPFGTAGPMQGDPRFGDIRVGAQPMSPEVLAIAVPPDPFVAGTLAGDVFFNSDSAWDGNRLFAVALHEAGHVFGLDDNTDPSTVMYGHLNMRTELAPGDIAALQGLYGARAPDAYEGASGNGTFQTATHIDPVSTAHGHSGSNRPDVVFADITTRGEADYYSLVPAANYRGPLTFRLRTAGVSMLEPRLTLFSASGQVLGEASSTDPTGSVLAVRLDQVQPNATYYARVEGAAGDVFGIGRYALAATLDATSDVSPQALDRVMRGPYETLSAGDIDSLLVDPAHTFLNDAHHSNDTLEHATRLGGRPGHPNTVLDTIASLSDAADVHFYRVTAPQAAAGARVMTVTLWGIGVNGIVPRVSVYAQDHSPVPADILLNGSGTYAVQVTDVRPGADYYLRVSAPADANPCVGNYALHVFFSRRDAELATFAAGALAAPDGGQSSALYVAESQLFQFVLSADAVGTTSGGAVRMSIFDSDGAEVFRLVARAGDTVSGPSLFLVPGAYTVRFTVDAPSGGPPLPYRLRGKSLSDPIGPVLEDPTLQPMYRSPTDPDLFLYPGDIISRDPFLFVVLLL
jgi:hypothetical protein